MKLIFSSRTCGPVYLDSLDGLQRSGLDWSPLGVWMGFFFRGGRGWKGIVREYSNAFDRISMGVQIYRKAGYCGQTLESAAVLVIVLVKFGVLFLERGVVPDNRTHFLLL